MVSSSGSVGSMEIRSEPRRASKFLFILRVYEWASAQPGWVFLRHTPPLASLSRLDGNRFAGQRLQKEREMNNEQRIAWNFPLLVIRRPLSFAVGATAVMVIVVALIYRLVEGNMLIAALNDLDTFTPVMISILMLRGLYAMRRDTDLQAVSMALIGALSFIFIYEAIYKLSFYVPPRRMGPAELREFIIQCGITLTAVAGFAYGRFHFSKWSKIFAAAFVLLYAFWMLTGFPQVNNSVNVYPAIIPVHWTWTMNYIVNRGTKVLMFFTYLFFYSGGKQTKGVQAEAHVYKLGAGVVVPDSYDVQTIKRLPSSRSAVVLS
jgi:hypothetical protein